MSELFTQDDIDKMLLWWHNLKEDFFWEEETKSKVNAITYWRNREYTTPKIEYEKTKNYRATSQDGFSFSKKSIIKDWVIIKCNLYSISWIYFFVPPEVYKDLNLRFLSRKYLAKKDILEVINKVKEQYPNIDLINNN